MKNGRFSSKKVSKALRFTTDGSASTCPKSGFTVASSVRFDVMPYFTSAPADSFWVRPHGDSPGAALLIGTDELFATVKGTTSSRWKGTMSRMQASTPSCDEIPLYDGRYSGQL